MGKKKRLTKVYPYFCIWVRISHSSELQDCGLPMPCTCGPEALSPGLGAMGTAAPSSIQEGQNLKDFGFP